jgi:pilus assembly protein CpaB
MAASNRKNSGRVIILVAVVLILILALAAVFFWSQNLLKPQTQPVAEPVQQSIMSEIVVIAQPVTRGTALTESVLTMIPYPQEKLIEGLFYTNIESVLDKKAKFDLPQGMPVTPSVLTEGQAGSYAAFQIPRGMVGITIPISRLTSMAYGLQPGDHVNVLTSLLLVDMDADFQSKLPNYSARVTAPGPGSAEAPETTASSTISSGGAVSTQGRTELDITLNQPIYVVPSESQRPRLVSQTLVYDAVVLWIGDFPSDGNISQTTTPVAATAEDAPPPPKDLITIIVTPQDAVTLNYLLIANAKFNFVLRGAGDTEKNATQAVTLQFVMDQYGIPYPSKLPYGMEPRRDEMLYPGEQPTILQ